MKFSFAFNNKRLVVNAREEKGLFRGIGLIFRTRNTNNVLFKFSPADRTPITSFFVFFPFVALWLDKNKKVIEKKRITPFCWSIIPKRNSSYLLELPINGKNDKIIRKIGFPVGKERFK